MGTTATSIEFGKTDAENPFRRRWVEILALQYRRLDLGERHAHGVGKSKRARRRPHALGASGQELVAKQRP